MISAYNPGLECKSCLGIVDGYAYQASESVEREAVVGVRY